MGTLLDWEDLKPRIGLDQTGHIKKEGEGGVGAGLGSGNTLQKKELFICFELLPSGLKKERGERERNELQKTRPRGDLKTKKKKGPPAPPVPSTRRTHRTKRANHSALLIEHGKRGLKTTTRSHYAWGQRKEDTKNGLIKEQKNDGTNWSQHVGTLTESPPKRQKTG